MSGHNKWSTIKHKKAAADQKRGKVFSRYSKEITLAAKAGGKDMDMNPRLRTAVAAAKGANMPNDNIDRAIKKGTGELQGMTLEEITYEGYGAGGVAVMVFVLTDNKNRTAANVRNFFTKNNGNLAGNGAVAWQFHRKAKFTITGDAANEEKLLDVLLNAGVDVDDVTVDDGVAEIVAPPDAFAGVAKTLEGAQIPVSESSLAMIPENNMLIDDVNVARQVTRLLESLEEEDDVQAVYSNLDMSDEVMQKLAEEG